MPVSSSTQNALKHCLVDFDQSIKGFPGLIQIEVKILFTVGEIELTCSSSSRNFQEQLHIFRVHFCSAKFVTFVGLSYAEIKY